MDAKPTDNLLFAIARESKGVDDLLDRFFSFLARRTDFFSAATPDRAQAAVMEAFHRNYALAQKEERRKAGKAGTRSKASPDSKAAAAEAEAKAKADAKAKTEAQAQAEAEAEAEAEAKAKAKAKADAEAAASSASSAAPASASASAPTPASASASEGDEDADEGAVPNAGNGADLGTYSWTQTLKEATVVVPVPAGTRGKDLAVVIGAADLSIGLKGEDPILAGKLFAAVIPDECTWTLEDAPASEGPGRLLTVILHKSYGMQWWSSIVEGEPKVNLAKVEPENSKLSDLDPETRKTVSKMMFDSQQKAMGKPTSDELQKQAMLQKFMEQHPEMDFSNAKMS